MTRFFRIFLWTLGAIALVILLLPAIATSHGGRIAWHLLVGWIGFLSRVVPQVTVNGNGVGMVVVCSVLIIAGIHSLCSWLFAHWNPPRPGMPSLRWRWTWSGAVYGGLWLLFLAVMGITGVVHQTGWLLTADVPLMVRRDNRGAYIIHLKNKATELVMAAEDNNWDMENTRRAFYATDSEHLIGDSRPNAIEDLHVLFVEGAKGELATALLFYRDPVKRENSGFAVVTRHGRYAYDLKGIAELPSALARYQRKESATENNTR